jgi:beta-glucosidase
VYVYDEPLASGFREASPFVTGPDYPLHALVDLAAGQVISVRVAYSTSVAISIPGTPVQPHLELGLRQPDDRVAQAAAIAGESDVALVLAGRITGEAMDADSLTLPGTQDALISAVAAANPRTIVVTLGAGPVVMPWLDDVPAVIHACFPGEQFAPALAEVLVGRTEPGGRLPITFPIDETTTPIPEPHQYPGVNGSRRTPKNCSWDTAGISSTAWNRRSRLATAWATRRSSSTWRLVGGSQIEGCR